MAPRRTSETRIGLLAAEEPPPVRRSAETRLGRVKELIPGLRDQRGTWFRIAEFPYKSAAGTVAAQLRADHPEVEWATRKTPAGGSVLWARHRTHRETKTIDDTRSTEA